MRPGRPPSPRVLTMDKRETLPQWAQRPKTDQALAQQVGRFEGEKQRHTTFQSVTMKMWRSLCPRPWAP